MMRIAVDAMGGDHAPSVDRRRRGGRRAAPRCARSRSSARRADLERALAAHADWRDAGHRDRRRARRRSAWPRRPAAALRRKPRASIRVAAELVAQQEAAALVSAGHTGATVMAAHAAFGMMPGVDRPALAAHDSRRGRGRRCCSMRAPTSSAGRSICCSSRVMGSVYARVALGVERPRVGLLSIGEEETKGNELTREAHRLLKAAPINFIGNVEGREIYSGVADVIVCDGFTGNVVLKTSEGLVETVEALLGDELRGTFSSQVGYLLSRRAFRRFRRRVDYSEYGGAPLLGVAGLAIVGHGRSSAKAVRNAIAMAVPIRDQRLRSPRRAGDRRRGARQVASRDRVHLSRTGIAEGRHGQGPGRCVSRSPAQTFDEADAAFAACRRSGDVRSGPPSEPLCFDGPEEDLQLTEITQPAILTASIAAYRVLAGAGHHAGLRRRPQPRRVLGQRGRGHVRVRRRGRTRAPARTLHAGGRAGRDGRDGRDSRCGSGSRARRRARRRRRARSSARPTSTAPARS